MFMSGMNFLIVNGMAILVLSFTPSFIEPSPLPLDPNHGVFRHGLGYNGVVMYKICAAHPPGSFLLFITMHQLLKPSSKSAHFPNN